MIKANGSGTIPKVPKAPTTPKTLAPPSGLEADVFVPKDGGQGIIGPVGPDIKIPPEELAAHVPPEYRPAFVSPAPYGDIGIGDLKIEIPPEELAAHVPEEYRPSILAAGGAGITIGATPKELTKVQNWQGTGCAPKINTYKVTLKGGGTILVEALDQKSAKAKAQDAGYKVAWVGARMSKKALEVYVAKQPKVVVATVKVKDGQTGETIEFSKSGWDAWPDKYRKLVTTEGYDAAMKVFKRDYYECADGQFILKTDFYALPTRYGDIAATKGFSAMIARFETDHVQLADGQWIPKTDWDTLVANDKELGTNFTDIGKSKGYDAMVTAIDKANEPYEEFLKKIEQGELIPVPGDEYITKAEFDKLPSGSQQILKQQGFAALAKATTIMYEKGPKPTKSWGTPEERYQQALAKWESMPQTITQEEMNKIPFFDKDMYSLSQESLGRAGLVALASIIPPAKAALPEYTRADITAFDWGIAAAQAPLIALGFAPGAIVGSVAGRAVTVGASTALSGLIGYATAKNWENMTPGQRVFGVGMTALCAIPLITTVARNVKISSPTIPTTDGSTVVWKGLAVAGHPIIGKSGGKWILGTRSISLPEARMILNGYKPEMMLETKVFVNQPALKKAGFTTPQIDYLVQTLKARKLFAGKASPWLDKNVLIEPTQRLTASEISIIQQRLANLKAGGLKDAHLLYGSPTIKAQAAPNLRNWRPIHDWDISLNMNQASTEAFTRTLLKNLQTKGGGVYRISPKSPTLIEKRIANTGNPAKDWTHIADIHSQEVAITSAMDIPTSKLDATGAYSYGRMVSEPAITVKYPGVGELRIMRLSESGVRKADTILRVRQTAEGTAFRPPERGIAQPGVPKDAADFYITVRTFCGEKIAEEWLESWAKAMGYSKTQLKTVLPRIRQSMLEVAAQTPSNIVGYEFKPSPSPRVTVGASPAIIVHIPSSLGASVSPKLESKISTPIYPYKLAQSPKIQSALSLAISSFISKMPSTIPSLAKVSPSVSRSLASAKVSPKPSPSPAVSKVPSPSPKLSPSTVPSLSPSVKPSPSSTPSKAPSSIPSPRPSPIPSPSPVPSPIPSPKPSPYPYPYPKLGPKPKRLPRMPISKEPKKQKREGPALATWKQGLYYVSIFPPFRTTGTKPDVVYSRQRPPWGSIITAKGRHAPRRTLRSMGRIPPTIELPMGVVTARIRNGRQLTFSRRRVNGRRRRR